jgi:hypothetical protein
VSRKWAHDVCDAYLRTTKPGETAEIMLALMAVETTLVLAHLMGTDCIRVRGITRVCIDHRNTLLHLTGNKPTIGRPPACYLAQEHKPASLNT